MVESGPVHDLTYSSYGRFSDIQASSLQTHCTPDPATGKTCNIYIAILSYVETSYTLLASLRNGFRSRVALTSGQPQEGSTHRSCLPACLLPCLPASSLP